MRAPLCLLLGGALLASAPSVTRAQQGAGELPPPPAAPPRGRGPGGGPGGGPGTGPLREQVRERIKLMRMWRLTEALSLDEATAQRLFPLLNRFDERLQPVHRQQGDLLQRLRQEVNVPRPDPARIGRTLDELVALRHQVIEIEDERMREVRRVLGPVQQAKLWLIWPKIDREIRRHVRRAMGLPVEED